MKTIQIIIERSKDAYWAYATNVEGISGVGNTAAEVKKSILEGIEIQKELGNIQNVNYDIKYKFDTQSLLNYYKDIFSAPALARLTGINEKQIHHYATGHRKPRPAMAKRFEVALHNLGKELIAVEL